MIIKGNRLHSTNFAEKIVYIDSDKGRSVNIEAFTICQNIRDRSLEGTIKAFQNNDTYRRRVKNGVVMYHDIISFKYEDSKHLDQNILRDLTQKYINDRARHAVVYAKPHVHNKNIHVHILISGTEYRSKKTLRLDNKRFMKVRRDLEKYQLEHYPDLKYSVVYGKEKDKMKQKDRDQNTRVQKEFELKKRGKITDKKKLQEVLLQCYKEAKDKEDFYKLLEKGQVQTYTRGKNIEPYGVTLNNRNYRFKTLGVDKEKITELEGRKQKQKEYKGLLKKYGTLGNRKPLERDKIIDF